MIFSSVAATKVEQEMEVRGKGYLQGKRVGKKAEEKLEEKC